MVLKKAAFLDRDGVINRDLGYVYKKKDLFLIDGVLDLVEELKNNNFLIIVVSNQAGVARGFFKESDVINFNNFLNKQIYKLTSFKIDKFYFCPYHPNASILKYKKKTLLRKPGNLMVERAINKFNISRKDSFLIGDKTSDIKCGEKSLLKSFLFNEKNLYKFYIKNVKNKF